MPSVEQGIKVLRGTFFAGIFAFAGWAGGHYMTDRAAYKEALEEYSKSFEEASGEVDQSLVVFSAIAEGKRERTVEDLTQLEDRLLKAVRTADRFSRRANDQQIIKIFRDAAIKLKDASSQATGPLTSKPLVKAVDDYAFAETQLRDRIAKQQRSLFF